MRPSQAAGRAIGAAGVAVLAGLLVPTLASARLLLPETGYSPNQRDTNTLYIVGLVFGILVFLAVEIGLIYSLVRFRARKGRVPAQIRGNTRLEVGWTAGAVTLVTILTVLVFVELGAIKNPPASGPNGLALSGDALFAATDQPNPPGGKEVRIHVNGQQYIWRYDYPNGAFAFETMVVPTDTTVVLDIEASDVGHQWWIPKLGAAVDAIPGYTNHSWLKVHKPGVYTGQCALLCGRGHATMVAEVCAVSPEQYQGFVEGQKAAILQANKNIADERALQARQGGSPGQPPNAQQLEFQVTAPTGPAHYIPPACSTPPRP